MTGVTGVTGVSDDARERLRNARGFIFDMDGMLVLGDRVNHGLRPLPGAISMLEWVRTRRLPYLVFTNGTNRTPANFARVLRDAGLDVPDELMMTPASSAVVMFAKRGVKRVLVLGVSGLIEPLREAGIEVVLPATGRGPAVPDVDAVFVGWFREFTMDHLEAACHAVWAGAELYSASETPFFASAGGRALGTSRAISAMIRSITGCSLTITGKPSLDALRAAADQARRARPAPGRGRRRSAARGADGAPRPRARGRGRHRPRWARRLRPPAAAAAAAAAPARRRRAARAVPGDVAMITPCGRPGGEGAPRGAS